ncbi:myoD family inhibitor domain-containing protein 2 [Clinocottus analis]|uniref:myoD family inhibitor domain-containing protein 2 n=1 Tax=Clinocottus analis TaxID=304258 RepID=UPI0035BF0EFD
MCHGAETNVFQNPRGEATAVSTCSPVAPDQPRPLRALLPSSTEACVVCEVSRSITSTSRSHKVTGVHAEPSGDDLCAAVLMACLFCHPLDCLLATTRGCTECAWSLCSFLCGCEPGTLRPLLEVAGHRCDLCDCLGAGRPLCDCTACDPCVQASECLDLCMEISQMLYH